MGLFNALISKLVGSSKSEAAVSTSRVSASTSANVPAQVAVPAQQRSAILEDAGLTFSVSISTSSGSSVPVSDEDLAPLMERYAFVLNNELSALKTADQWWNGETHKRRLRDGSEKALAWLEPFVPVELAQSLLWRNALTESGPLRATSLARELRALIRDRRKAKEPHEELLRALYGACVLADFVASLKFEFVQPHQISQFVDIREVRVTHLDYAEIGYRSISSLSKTDVKWLSEAFGEPSTHRSVADALLPLIQSSISRYCWTELRSSRSYARGSTSMRDWLRERLSTSVSIAKDNEARMRASMSPSFLPQSARRSDSVVSLTSSTKPREHVSDSRSSTSFQQYAHVLSPVPFLKPADQWWETSTYLRRLREDSEEAYAWMLPFVPFSVVTLKQVKRALELGPYSVSEVPKALRKLIRQHQTAGRGPQEDLLRGLYGASLLADFAASLNFEGLKALDLAQFVDIKELYAVGCDYVTMGYEGCKSLSISDKQWLVEAFGEPRQHQSFESAWNTIRHNAINRYCWTQLQSYNNAFSRFGLPQQSIEEWLCDWLKHRVGGPVENFEQTDTSEMDSGYELLMAFNGDWIATQQPFIVADLETTGLDAKTDEVLEVAAVKVAPSGVVMEEFSMLVRVSCQIPDFISKLTGITQEVVDREGQSLASAMRAFLSFVERHPIFFPNAPFDERFLRASSVKVGLSFHNPIHDTLPVARATWPSLRSHKLTELAKHVGVAEANHRALGDAKATLSVLLAARKRALEGSSS